MEYLKVKYEDRLDAKSLGAKWNPAVKKWYIPIIINPENKQKLKLKYRDDDIKSFNNEDRTFGGNELYVDLIPSTCWFSNVRYCVDNYDWDRIRKFIYKRVNYKCECCNTGINEHNRLEAHERWSYDYDTRVQKLVRLIALCHRCHKATHYGLQELKGTHLESKNHIMNVRKFTDIECDNHIKDAFDLYHQRNKMEWTLDLSMLDDIRIKLCDDSRIEIRDKFLN